MIYESYLPSIASGLFYFQDSQLRLLVDGIVMLPYVESVWITENQPGVEKTILISGTEADSHGDIHEYPLVYEFYGAEREIGTLYVATSMDRIRIQLADQVRAFTVVNLFKIFGFAFAVLFIAQKMIFRHLGVITRFALDIDSANIHNHKLELPRYKGVLHGTDELDDIKNAINKMLENLAIHLEEKEVLIRELYHRTYNNMQVIQSLLEYRLSSQPDMPMDQFVENINRQIHSMALAHRELYNSEHLSRLDLGEYLKSLTILALEYHPEKMKSVSVSFDLEPVKLLLDSAIPLGIVINELICNALNHAFPGDRVDVIPGEIKVASFINESGEIEILVSDNGVGWPPESGISRLKNGGLSLVTALVEKQLGGSIHFNGEKGIVCIIRFRDNLYLERV